MLWLEKGLYLKVQEVKNGPSPLPLQSGFSGNTAYRALGCVNPVESDETWYILSNDRDEIMCICSRHLRTVFFLKNSHDFRIPLYSSPGVFRNRQPT